MQLINLEKKLRLDPKVRDFQWYRRLHVQGRLFINKQPILDSVFEQFRLAVKTTEEIYPGLWDIDVSIDTPNFVTNKIIKININGIVVRFPEVTIKNSRRNSHVIRDLFIKTQLRQTSDGNGRLILGTVYGGRTTFTFAETNSCYMHSHLPGRTIDSSFMAPGYNNFCTGSGEINIAVANLNSDGFTVDRFVRYLLNLDTLASWESIEGVPYKKIAEINSFVAGARIFNYSDSYTSYFINAIKLNKHTLKRDLKLNFKLEGSSLKIIEDETFIEFLMRVPIEESHKYKFLCLEAGPRNPGVYYQYGSTGGRPVIPVITSKYIFQGIEIPVIITDVPADEQPVIEYKFHPRVKQAIKKELEYAANKAIIRKSTVNRYKDRSSTVREDSKPDPVLVSADS